MTYHQRNKDLLNKHKPYNKMCQEEIEMEIIERSPRSRQVYHQPQSNAQYFVLQDNNPHHQSQAERRKKEQIPVQKPFNDKIITMNGQTFKLVEEKPKEPKPSKSKLPTMHVSCHGCRTVQTVPGTSTIFDCGVCRLRNQCTPIYAILRCYSCNTKVLYSVGSSQFIKCTKCLTVNEVPSNARKARGASDVDPRYQVYFDKHQMQKEHKANPYVRYNFQNELEELISDGSEIEKKYPDL